VQFWAARALVRSDERALPALDLLIQAFGADIPVRDSAAWAVTNLGRPAIPAVLGLLKSGPMPHRAFAAAIIGRIGACSLGMPQPEAAMLVPPLVDALNDSEPSVRLNAVSSLRDLESRFVAPILAKLLENHDDQYREQTALALAHLSPSFHPVPTVKDALTGALNDTNGRVRSSAAMALRRCGRDPENGGKALPRSRG
jgi:HEAT repeat protein